MNSLKLLLVVAAVLVAAAGSAEAQTVLYVDDDTCPLVGSGTLQDPFCSIQHAFEQAVSGDELRVLPGTYNECVNAFGLFVGTEERSVHIVAQDWIDRADNATTIIDATGVCDAAAAAPSSAVIIGGSDVRLEGFTVTGAGFSGVFAFGNAVITNNLITANESTEGGGLYFYPAACYYGNITATISSNQVTGNTAVFDTNAMVGGDGGGMWVTARAPEFTPGCALGGDVQVTIQANTITNNSADAYGGGLLAFTNADTPRSASIVITQNTIDNNNSSLAVAGYGGGAYVSTFGYGAETIEISGNNVRGNASLDDGGGMSNWVRTLNFADHQMTVENNTITGNTAALGGGGLDLFFELRELDFPQSASLLVRNNTLTGNEANATGGAGILATVISERSPTPNALLSISGNRVTGNTSQFFGGGMAVIASADADPDDGLGPILPADAAVDVSNNRVTGNTASGGFGDGTGGGVFVFTEAKGDAVTTVDLWLNTIGDNVIDDANGAGGVHIESFTQFDSGPGVEGFAEVTLNSSVVLDNDGVGVGGPFPGDVGIITNGGTANLSTVVTYNSLFGNAGGDLDTWIVPGTGNLGVDPQLNATTFAPLACSPTLDAGDPALDFTAEAPPNGGRINMGHTGGTSSATPSLADPTGDGIVDGVDVVRLSVAFGASTGQPRFDPSTDLDSSGMVDGTDLAFISGDFGDVCP